MEAIKIIVNGVEHECREDKTLLRYLRDDLKLMSVKDGCSQGGCGTCMIILNGKNVKACTRRLSKLDGAEVTTVEGLSDLEKEVYTYAFGECGAVQCGFCTPGMVISAKAVLDKNPNPTEDEIKKGIRQNICRCTGYKKIIEAIELSGKIFRGEVKMEEQGDTPGVGEPFHRVDVREKVLGYGEYVDDVEMEGMTYASAIRTKYPRARVLSIDAGKALELDGVIGVLDASDVPNNKVGHIQQDWDAMIAVGDITRSIGDAICLVIAESEEILEKAKELVVVEYEELEPVRSIEEALKDGAPKVHEAGNMCQTRHVTRGNAAEAIKNSKYVITESFETPFTEHAFLEPECSIAYPYKDGVKVLSSDQGTYDVRKEIGIMFGWDDLDRVVVENKLVGGAFGGKEDVSVQHLAALAAMKYQRPVKIKMTREESINFHPKRHAMEGTFTVGCDENGILQGLDCDIYFDTGAYASLCGPVLERACTHSVGPYKYQNTDIRGYGVYTNNPPAGAFRGFGVCQSNFAFEMILTKLAEKVGISPWEIRYINAIEPEHALPNGQIADVSTALKETLEAVKDVYDANRGHVGIACAMKNSGVGVGLPDMGRAKLVVEDGIVKIYCASTDLGQGFMTVAHQIFIETTGLPLSKFELMPPNTENSPDSGTTSGSRQTLLSGEAIKEAAKKLVVDLKNHTLDELEGKIYEYEYFEPTDPLGSDKANPKSHIAYGYATHVVVLDDDGYVKDVYAAHDSGKVINPISIQGQIEGGVLMSLGYALTEDMKLKDCRPTTKFAGLGLLKSTDIPNIEAIYVEKDELLDMAYGAKGIGEIATIPTAAAVGGAYYELDGIFRTKMPMEDTAYSKPKKIFKNEDVADKK